MKKLYAVLLVSMSVVAVARAAGPIGLMVSETPALKEKNAKTIAGGITIGDDSDFFGGRFSYAVSERVLLFGDLGIVDLEDVDDEDPGLQAGAIINIPAELPFDIGFRGSFATAFFDDVDYYNLSAMLLAGKDFDTQVRGLSVYGGLGFFYWDAEYDVGGPKGMDFEVEDDDTELALALGALIELTEKVDIYVEFNEADDSFFGGGARMEF